MLARVKLMRGLRVLALFVLGVLSMNSGPGFCSGVEVRGCSVSGSLGIERALPRSRLGRRHTVRQVFEDYA